MRKIHKIPIQAGAPTNIIMKHSDPEYDIVTACRLKDVKTLGLALPRLQEFLPHRRLVVFTAKANFPRIRNRLGTGVECVDEDEVFFDLKLENLRREVKLPGFPQGAGWYFQQFLKFSYPQIRPDMPRYLIWDADTVPLRRFAVFAPGGKALLTPATMEAAVPPHGVLLDAETEKKMERATRPHAPYFENYRHLLGQTPHPGRSFIAQQMPIHVPTLQALLDRIETRFPGPGSWAWKILTNLRGSDGNLFSEYEFYAQYALQHAAEHHDIRSLRWSRAGRLNVWPSAETQFSRWAMDLDYVALESSGSPWRRRIVKAFHFLPASWQWQLRKGR